MNEPNVLTRMRLSCCWGDNLNEKELNEVVDYINFLQRELTDYKERNEKAIEYATKEMRIVNDNEYHRLIEILDKKDKE